MNIGPIGRIRGLLLLVAYAPMVVGIAAAALPASMPNATAMVLGIGCGLTGLSWIIVLVLTRPLAQITLAAEGVADGHALDHDIPVRRGDEFGVISAALVALDNRLQATTAAYRQTANEVKDRMTTLVTTDAVPELTAGVICPEEVTEATVAMTKLARQTAAVRERMALLTRILQKLPRPVIALDDGGRIGFANPAGERVLGKPLPVARGRDISDFLVNPEETTDPLGRRLLKTTEFIRWLPDAGNEEAVVELQLVPGTRSRMAVAVGRGEWPDAKLWVLAGRDPVDDYTLASADRARVREETLREAWAGAVRAGAEETEKLLAQTRLLLGEAKQSTKRDVLVPRANSLRQQAASFNVYFRSIQWLSRGLWGELPAQTPSEFEAEGVARAAADELSARLQANGITLDVSARGAGWLCCDEEWLRTSLIGLLAHAADSVRDTTIGLRVHRLPPTDYHRAGQVAFEVIDAGPAVSQEWIRSLDNPFSGLTASPLIRPTAGFIPGLVLARILAAEMGGGVAFDATPADGLILRLTVPIRLAVTTPIDSETLANVADGTPIEELCIGWKLGVA